MALTGSPTAWRVRLEPCDPGTSMPGDGGVTCFSGAGDILDIDTRYTAHGQVIHGVIQTTPDKLQYVLEYMWALNKGYNTGRATVEAAIASMSP